MQNNPLKITGSFHCKVFEHGKLIKDFTGRNLVVDYGKQQLLEMLAAGASMGVSRIGFGEGTAAPDPGDLRLTDPFYTKNITSYTRDPLTTSVVFNWELGNTDANGITITEFGLLMNGDQLFARKTGLTIAKNPTITLTGAWTITIS